MSKKCLYCYTSLPENMDGDFHERCSLSFFGSKTPPALEYSMNQMAELAKSVIERSVAVPGVQPKLSLSLVHETLQHSDRARLTVVSVLGDNYILKPPSQHFSQMPENEHLTMRIAENVFNLKTVASSLIRLQSGELAYITRRIDRKENGEKIHMLDMFQILEAFDKYKGSMERIGKAINTYSANPLLDLTEYYMLAIFCFLTGNNDMHLKNFSMILQGNEWGLAPAYDLLNVTIVLPEDKEEMALTIEGKKRKLEAVHLSNFGLKIGLNERQIKGIFTQFQKKKSAVFEWIDKSFLTAENKMAYKELIEQRYKTLSTEIKK